MIENALKTEIITVRRLLQYNKLMIPIYQRPYKWTVKNVNQLINDIVVHKYKSEYRLGTIVIHDDGYFNNIVDGQQRAVTLALITQAIIENKEIAINNPELKNLLKNLEGKNFNPEFDNEISISNIQTNYSEICRQVASFDEETISFLFNKCEFVQFILTDISEAFQFFDSQNARGKDLEPHDLLKAFHLREFSKSDEYEKFKVVETWETLETKELSNLFGEYLYRIKDWSKGNSARYFNKEKIELFKGINIEKINNYPYTEILRIAHFYIDRYNNSYERSIDFNNSEFPFQINQTIINGRRFFEMVSHYKQVFDSLIETINNKIQLNKTARLILKKINHYDGQLRTGDGYVRILFDCALILYIDKFGVKDLSKAIEKVFIWAYSLRLNYQNVLLASVDNYVVQELNLLKIINDANVPDDVLTIYLEPVKTNRSTKTKDIENIFRKMKYYGN